MSINEMPYKFLSSLCVLFLSVSMLAQTKRALVIGIGEQKDKNWTKINGDKDVPYVQRMLGEAGYNDVRTLVNSQATKSGILAAFKKLSCQCATDDHKE